MVYLQTAAEDPTPLTAIAPDRDDGGTRVAPHYPG